MKTMIDIPDSLYKRAKIMAKETGRTVKDLLINSLEKELDHTKTPPSNPTWITRELVPEYQEALKTGAFSHGIDSAKILSDDRTSRENALL